MDPGHADVVDALDLRAEHAQRFGAFLGDWQIARARAEERHRTRTQLGDRRELDGARAGELDVAQFGHGGDHVTRLVAVETGYQDILACARDFAGDSNNLRRRLPLPEDDLRRSYAQRAMVIDRGVA